jgi:hypothetical protein
MSYVRVSAVSLVPGAAHVCTEAHLPALSAVSHADRALAKVYKAHDVGASQQCTLVLYAEHFGHVRQPRCPIAASFA